MKMNLELGLIDGDQKRVLECYIDSRLFRQRKNYDEYYVDSNVEEFKGGLDDLGILAEVFGVRVDAATLTTITLTPN